MLVNKYFRSKKLLLKQILGKKNDFGQNIFLVTTIFDKKKLLKNFDTKNYQIKFWSKKIFIEKKFGQNKFWTYKNFSQKKIWSKFFLVKKKFP